MNEGTETKNGNFSVSNNGVSAILKACQKLKFELLNSPTIPLESQKQGKRSKTKIFFPRGEFDDFHPIKHLSAVLQLHQTTQSKEQFVSAEENYISEFDVVEASNNRIKLGFGSSNKKDKVKPFADALLSLPHGDLKIKKTTAFLESVNMELLPQKVPVLAPEITQPQEKIKFKTLKSDVLMLRIGSWETVRLKSLDDIVAKCYFGKRQLVWEILENRLKKKIQIPWEHILAMRVSTEEKQYGVLEIELSNPPSFFWETEPTPKRHTVWKKGTDFTDGQATICRWHYLQLHRDTHEKFYATLLRVPEFFKMSQIPFPSPKSPRFPSDIRNAGRDASVSCKRNASKIMSVQAPRLEDFQNVSTDIYFGENRNVSQPQHSQDLQNMSVNCVSFSCTGIDQESDPVQKKPKLDDVHNVDTGFSIVSSEIGPQISNFQQPPYSSAPISLPPIHAYNQVNQTISCQKPVPCNDILPTSAWDMTLDEGNTGVENASNMVFWDQLMKEYANIPQRDMMSMDYNLPLTYGEEGLQNQSFLLPMNYENGFSNYSNMVEGLNHSLPFSSNEEGFQDQHFEVPMKRGNQFPNPLNMAEDSNVMIDPFMTTTNYGDEWIGDGDIGSQSYTQPISWGKIPEDILVNRSYDPNETMKDFTGIQEG